VGGWTRILRVDRRRGGLRREQSRGAECAGAPIVLYLPKIQTAEEAALWNRILTTLEQHLGLSVGTIRTYVLVEQVEDASS
jgi:malate synthase